MPASNAASQDSSTTLTNTSILSHLERLFAPGIMLTKPRRWFTRKPKKQDDSDPPQVVKDQTEASAMTELAESLQKEIQGLAVEIKGLKKDRDQLFRDIHDIMLSKTKIPRDASLSDSDGGISLPYEPPPAQPTSPLTHHRSTQSLWFPKPLVALPIPPETGVVMGLFGPRSRASSLNGRSEPAAVHTSGTANRPRPLRSMSEAMPAKTVEANQTTRTAWRIVNRRGESVDA